MSEQPLQPRQQTPLRLSRAQLGSISAVLLSYALLSHYGASEGAPKGLNVALSFGPLLLILAVMTWRCAGPWAAVSVTAVIAGVFYHEWEFLGRHYDVADLIEQCGVYALIALGFAQSMVSARGPVFVRIAVEMHGALTSRERAYARIATLAWAFFYLSIAVAIVALYFAATRQAWVPVRQLRDLRPHRRRLPRGLPTAALALATPTGRWAPGDATACAHRLN